MCHAKQTGNTPSSRLRQMATKAALATALTGCTSQPSHPPSGEPPRLAESRVTPQPQNGALTSAQQTLETQEGSATFIGEEFQGKQTASGEVYDPSQLVAAHLSYPLGTLVRVTDAESGRVVEVRVIDRSSSAKVAGGSVIDLSRAAAERLGITPEEGRVRVKAEVIEWGRVAK